jgi:Flp pilus assembly pilin Flp
LIALAMGVAMITFGTSLSTYLDDLGTYISNVFTSSCARLRCP